MVALPPELQKNIDKYRAKYDDLPPRDRLALSGMSIFLAFVLLYLLIWQPASDSAAKAQLRFEKSQGLIAWMKANESKAIEVSKKSGRSRQTQSGGKAILTIINMTSRAQGVTLKRFEPAGNDKIRIWLEKAPFDAVLSWLLKLESEHGIRVSQFTADAEDTPGLMTGKINLVR